MQRRTMYLIGISFALAGCAGASLPVSQANSTVTTVLKAQPKKTPLPAPLVVRPESLKFGSAVPQTIAVSEKGYTDVLSAKSSNTNVAIVSPNAQNGPKVHFTVFPTGGGTCKITVRGASGKTSTVDVSVSSTVIVVSSRTRGANTR